MTRTTTLAPPLRGVNVTTGYVKQVKQGPGVTQAPPHPLPLKGVGGGVGVCGQGIPGPDVVGEIKNLAKQLDPQARRKLLAELSLAGNDEDNQASRDLDMWSASVYDALATHNGGMSGGLPGPAVVKRTLASSGAWSIVKGFMEDAKLSKLSVPERLSVYRLLADLLVTHAHGISMRTAAPLSPKLVANCSNNITSIFDKAFPGYVRAGLAHIVARQLTSTPS